MLTVSFQPGLCKAQLGEQKHIVSRGNGCKSCRHMGSGEATSPQETATSPEAGRTGEEGWYPSPGSGAAYWELEPQGKGAGTGDTPGSWGSSGG